MVKGKINRERVKRGKDIGQEVQMKIIKLRITTY